MRLIRVIRAAHITLNLSYKQFVFIIHIYGGNNKSVVSAECVYTHRLLSDQFTTKKKKENY